MNSINFESLLSKYINHVRQCEGVDFTDNLGQRPSDVEFTEEEKQYLQNQSRLHYLADEYGLTIDELQERMKLIGKTHLNADEAMNAIQVLGVKMQKPPCGDCQKRSSPCKTINCQYDQKTINSNS